jgi:hypothetical protein
MAKKPVAESTTKTPSHKVAGKEISLARRTGESRGEGLIPRSRERERVAQPGEGRGARPSSLLDTRVVYCGDNLEQFAKLPDGPCRTGHRWGETKEKRAFEDRHENTKAYIDYMRPRCVQLARVLKQTGSFYYHCDWHASYYPNFN